MPIILPTTPPMNRNPLRSIPGRTVGIRPPTSLIRESLYDVISFDPSHIETQDQTAHSPVLRSQDQSSRYSQTRYLSMAPLPEQDQYYETPRSNRRLSDPDEPRVGENDIAPDQPIVASTVETPTPPHSSPATDCTMDVAFPQRPDTMGATGDEAPTVPQLVTPIRRVWQPLPKRN
jgi:hypothetical protein